MPQYSESFVDKPRNGTKYRFGASKLKKEICRNKRRFPFLVSVGSLAEATHGGECDSPSPSPLQGSGGPGGGHKASFRSTKLARRARSFKEDFLEKISQMRSPGTQGGRALSPKVSGHHVSHHHKTRDTVDKPGKPDINLSIRQVQVALKHFRDVISKNTLEMLSGNGTIVLENVLTILNDLKPVTSNDQSSTISSATNQVHQTLARLIKLCDDVMLNGNKSSALNQENVEEIVTLLETAVQNLVKITQNKMVNRESTYKTTPRTSYANSNLDMPAQRNSLPDIPLTPREREILEQTSYNTGLVRSSHSSESILRDNSPPPKPPLPDGICLSEPDSSSIGTPPPLPPKKRPQRAQQLIEEYCSDNSLLACNLDRMSLRSRSPEDSSSLLSASAGSLDSVLNHSREEEEIRALMDQTIDDSMRENDLSEIVHANGNCACEDSFCNNQLLNNSSDLNVFDNNRLSNTDSGFVSIHSHRNSLQSYSASKRSSQQSSSSQWSTQNSKQLSNLFTQQTSAFSAESNLTSMQKSESIIQNMSFQTEVNKSVTTESYSQVEKVFSTTSSSQVSDLSMLHSITDVVDGSSDDTSIPPAIPQKTRSRKGKYERQPSPYDNVPVDNIGGELLVTCSMHQSQSTTSTVTSTSEIENGVKPPPLPLKKRHMFQSVAYSVMAYMEMFGNCSHSNDNEFMRHSVHMVHLQNQQSLDSSLPNAQSYSFMQNSSHTIHSNLSVAADQRLHHTSPSRSPNSISPNSCIPPALPPKRSRPSSSKSSLSPPVSPTALTAPTNHSENKLSPKLPHDTHRVSQNVSPISVSTPVAPHKNASETKSSEKIDEGGVDIELDLMEELDVEKYLVMKKAEEDGPDIRGGYIDALIVHATKTDKDSSYQEAFLTTYRTFISPYELVIKLIRRYQYFVCQPERKQRARETFYLLRGAINDLTVSDLDSSLLECITEFVYQLVCNGNLANAKEIRIKVIEKYTLKQLMEKVTKVQTTLSLAAGCATLLDFKSEQIAEQMTLLDANLFMKIEIPEVLIWAQEQNEERSPNLTRFTEHFNKMSYWARTKILQAEAKDREKYVMKFIKIMKHLRKINNFNSYLALLSALDSAPIRRLEWQKHITEGLKEYCALIDSSSSFRAYRQALADTSPPCIPYIGLVLQDLTFVHIGNSNLLADGTINFSKRWQQFNIVENMKRFKKCSFTFKKHERITAFFHNFDEFIGEDAMWQISESIKPRGGKKPVQ